MGTPSNRQTTIIQPDKPTLVQYSQSLTPQRNYAAEFDAYKKGGKLNERD